MKERGRLFASKLRTRYNLAQEGPSGRYSGVNKIRRFMETKSAERDMKDCRDREIVYL